MALAEQEWPPARIVPRGAQKNLYPGVDDDRTNEVDFYCVILFLCSVVLYTPGMVVGVYMGREVLNECNA